MRGDAKLMNLENVLTGSSFLQSNEFNRQRTSTTVGKVGAQVRERKPADLNDEEVINPKQVETVVEQMNGFIDPLRTNLKFVFHEELNEYYVAVVNHLTNEVIREIPPKKMLDSYAAMAEFMGILVDEKI